MGFIYATVVSTSFPHLQMPWLGVFDPHLSLATSEGDVDESSGVLEALESAALGDLGFLLGLNLNAAGK